MKTTASASGVTRWTLDAAEMDVRHYPGSDGAMIGIEPQRYTDDGCERILSRAAIIELVAALAAALLEGEPVK